MVISYFINIHWCQCCYSLAAKKFPKINEQQIEAELLLKQNEAIEKIFQGYIGLQYQLNEM